MQLVHQQERSPQPLTQGEWLDFLATQSPETWHRVACGWSWDKPHAVLFWIAEQPECDRATAHLLVRMAARPQDPLYQVRHAATKERLRQAVSKRWEAGFYVRDRLTADASFQKVFSRRASDNAAGREEFMAANGRLAAAAAKPTAEEVLIEYLETQSPDEWHRVALSWNWDAVGSVLPWILKQPDCDKATAQMLFHRASPIEMLTEARRGNGYEQEIALCRLIAERWNGGQYRRTELASDGDNECFAEHVCYRDVEAGIGWTRLPWTIEDSMFDVLQGRTLDPATPLFDEGYPKAVLQMLADRGISRYD